MRIVTKNVLSFVDLEDLIKKILVKNPAQRYTIEQIKEHPWMQQRADCNSEIYRGQNDDFNFEKGIDGDLNVQILTLMKGLQIDIDATKKVKLLIQISAVFRLGIDTSLVSYKENNKAKSNPYCYIIFTNQRGLV